jgi:MarR family transcriptional regulator, organic hydroperoxide resistance regulator
LAAAKKAAPSEPAAPAIRARAGLGFFLREAYRAFARDLDARLARHGITHAQWVLLWFLSQAGSLTPLALARQAGIKKASATAVIDALKQRRLIRGDPDRIDRRKVNLHLTPAGIELMKDLVACAARTNADARAGYSEQEMETLFSLLRGVTVNLEKASANS